MSDTPALDREQCLSLIREMHQYKFVALTTNGAVMSDAFTSRLLTDLVNNFEALINQSSPVVVMKKVEVEPAWYEALKDRIYDAVSEERFSDDCSVTTDAVMAALFPAPGDRE